MTERLRRIQIGLFGAVVVFVLTGVAVAQDADPPPTAPPPAQEETEQDEKKKDPPSLDDLLGIKDEATDDGTTDAANREIDEELQRELTEQQIADAFKAAVEKMAISADLLDVKFDAGLGTQRVQEDIIEKLQQLIDRAKQQSQCSSSSSSSGGQQQQQQNQQNPGRQGGKPQDGQSGENQQGGTENQGETDPPPGQDGPINTVLEETRSEWGSLPERIRDLLLQGRQETYSSLYDRLTSEYYRKLAEENSR